MIKKKGREILKSSTTSFDILLKLLNLTKLNISGIKLDKNASKVLCELFEKNSSTLECLIMNECNLTTEIANKFLEKLRDVKKYERNSFM